MSKEDTKFKPGQSGNPNGRPKGSISIKTKIKQRLEAHPEKLEELVDYYLNELKMRDLLWKMIDGIPKQQVEIEQKQLPVPILAGVRQVKEQGDE
jgi:hypothetical protein